MMAPASLKGSEHYPASLSLPNLGKTLRILLLSGGSSSQTVGITLTLARAAGRLVPTVWTDGHLPGQG